MNNLNHYSMDRNTKARKIMILLLVSALCAWIGYTLGTAANAEETMAKCWVMCKPGEGQRVHVRSEPNKGSAEIGFLEAGDWFMTDGESLDGWIRCHGVGEQAGWIYSGYVVTEEPEQVFERYVCVAQKQVACRRWIGGPQIDGRGAWLKNGSNVDVFLIADGWAVTSRGYIRSEWLEVDPE